MGVLTRWINEVSRNRDNLRSGDRVEQKAGRMSPYEDISKEDLEQFIRGLRIPLMIAGVYRALIPERTSFKNGEEFLDNSTFLSFADRLSISKNIIGADNVRRNLEHQTNKENKISLRWHMPGDNSFFTPHAGGPGYDFPGYEFIDIHFTSSSF